MTTDAALGQKTLLLVGASRGLGQALGAEFVKRGWNVVGTVRGGARTGLHELAERHPGRVEIEQLDVTEPSEIAALHDRLSGRSFDMLFVNSGTANPGDEIISKVSTEDFVRVMLTNVLGVMRAVEGLDDLVRADGVVGVMSSGQGSVGNNLNGGHEVYRGSKAALNQSMRSYAARQAGGRRALVLMAPGWIRTDMGGPDAPFGVEDTIPSVADVLLAQEGGTSLRYLDRNGQTVPW